MTKEEALAKVATKWWETATTREIVEFQLFEDRLCMPFGDFHGAVEKELGRPVFTHEFAEPARLREEFRGTRPPATAAEVFGALDPARTIYVAVDK